MEAVEVGMDCSEVNYWSMSCGGLMETVIRFEVLALRSQQKITRKHEVLADNHTKA